MLSKLELENSQALYFELDNKLMDAYRLAQEGIMKILRYILSFFSDTSKSTYT